MECIFDRTSSERKLIDRILVLQNGQASIERGFSVNSEAMEVNQLEEFLFNKDTDMRQMSITREKISYCRNTSRRYKERLAMQKAAKENDDAAARQRKRKAQDLALKETEIKRRRMELMALEKEVLVLRKK